MTLREVATRMARLRRLSRYRQAMRIIAIRNWTGTRHQIGPRRRGAGEIAQMFGRDLFGECEVTRFTVLVRGAGGD